MSRGNSTAISFFLIFFLPLWILGGGTVIMFYQAEVEFKKKSIESAERHNLVLLKKIISEDFQLLISDLMFLSEQNELKSILEGDESFKDKLAQEYLSFFKTQKIYDQIRYIDISGWEKVRVNYNHGSPTIVKNELLQNKSDRYYFKETVRLDRHEVFVSPFDLNVEQGVIETPLKPTIRFATPVFDRMGSKQGIVVLNYFGNTLIQKIVRETHKRPGNTMLVNSDGYWLIGPKPENEWGFMFELKRRDQSFVKVFPTAWKKIHETDEGQFSNEHGLFTYTTVYPSEEVKKSINQLTRQGEKYSFSGEQLSAFWKVVNYVPQITVRSAINPLFSAFLVIFFLLTILFAVVSLLPTYVNLRRIEAERLLKDANEKLEKRVEQRTAELKKTNLSLNRLVRELADIKFALDETAIVGITDKDGVITYVNDKFCQMAKYAREELLGRRFSTIGSGIISENQSRELFHTVLKGEVWRGTLKNKSGEGSFYWVDAYVVPFLDEDQTPYQYVIILSDISEIKRAEEQLQQANLENFASGLAHEIGNPLGSMRTMVQSIQEDHEDDSLYTSLENVIQEIDRLNKIVRDFNSLGRPSPPSFSVHKPKDLFLGLLPLIESEIKNKGINLSTHFDPRAHQIKIDSQQIQQVLLNLVVNAFQAMPEEGTLLLGVQNVWHDDYPFTSLYVQDNGPGIPEDLKERIFDPFFTTKTVGSGFGLSLASSFVKQNGGQIRLDSQLGHGSTFSLLFPAI